jgi:hypothetical protein
MTVTISAMTLAGVMTLNAQAPQQPAQPERQTPISDSARAQTGQMLMITGCLKEEKDVPGLKPNVAERAGVSEDYILTDVKMSPASKVSGIALATKYEIEGISKDDLKKHLNHQVEISGTITQPEPSGNDATADFHGTSLKMLSATCAAQ